MFSIINVLQIYNKIMKYRENTLKSRVVPSTVQYMSPTIGCQKHA